MFYAAWLHLQRKTHIAVNDYTSAVLQAERGAQDLAGPVGWAQLRLL